MRNTVISPVAVNAIVDGSGVTVKVVDQSGSTDALARASSVPQSTAVPV